MCSVACTRHGRGPGKVKDTQGTCHAWHDPPAVSVAQPGHRLSRSSTFPNASTVPWAGPVQMPCHAAFQTPIPASRPKAAMQLSACC
eukprot:157776-Chlamydomonas_euryale.AAC.5